MGLPTSFEEWVAPFGMGTPGPKLPTQAVFLQVPAKARPSWVGSWTQFSATLAGRDVVGARLAPIHTASASAIVAQLKQKYPRAKHEIREHACSNGYGAQWSVKSATWTMPGLSVVWDPTCSRSPDLVGTLTFETDALEQLRQHVRKKAEVEEPKL
jgi:hypothetical protein